MKLKNFIRATWELPQHIAGFIVTKIYKAQYVSDYKTAKVYHWDHKKGHSMSLGKYIFMYRPSNIKTLKHEYGHTIQSKYLGWLYPIVIGLPSFVWCNCFEGYRERKGKSYYSFYTEKWADKLGGVERGEKKCQNEKN